MSKANKNDLQESADKKLPDDALEQVSGGQIELVEDESAYSIRAMTNQRINTNPLSRGDYLA